jgi:hypothetical protein
MRKPLAEREHELRVIAERIFDGELAAAAKDWPEYIACSFWLGFLPFQAL